ncbi:MAG: hypothetical protein LBP75_11860 [Planctomycetota bacterium]|jgi:hypothetical protein|nr:hypothetical protein [Planctomycetota bacterium]
MPAESLPPFAPDRVPHKKKGCGCGVFLFLLFGVVAFIAGYVLHEAEDCRWERDATTASLRAKMAAWSAPLTGLFASSAQSGSTVKDPPRQEITAAAIIAEIKEKIDPQEFSRLGDEAYARARQLLQKNNRVAPSPPIVAQIIEELQSALTDYQTAQTHGDTPALRQKIATTEKAITELQKSRK